MTESPARSHAPSAGVAVTAAIGICLVAYSYLGALWVNRHGSTPAPLLLVREWVNKPVGIGEDFGVLGVALLLISAGYVVTSAFAALPAGRAFAVLTLRVMIPVVIAVTLSAVITLGGGLSLTEPAHVDVTLSGYLADLLMVGGLTDSGSLLGLGWALTAGAVFLVLLLGTSPAARSAPWLAPALQLLALAVIAVTASAAQGWYQRLGMLVPFVSMPVFGQILSMVRAGRLSGWTAAAPATGCLALLITAEGLYTDLAGWMYALTGVYASMLTLLAVSGFDRPGRSIPVRWLASRAFPLFLLLGTVGYATLSALHLRVPLSLAFVAAVLLTGVTAEGCHRLATTSGLLFTRSFARREHR